MRNILLLAIAPSALLAQGQPTHPDSARARRDTIRTLETVTVSAIRALDQAPISAKTLDADELERRSFGQDVPLLLQGTPSFTAYSETGNYWGYSYIRMRGIDQSRINLTIDGIPLNDPEDQVLYFADFPDIANSVHSIQIQRGVGTSSPGTASYGGSINFETVPVASARRGTEFQLQSGSFGSRRASAEYTSGLTSGNVAMYGRVSALQSGGYRRHSGMEGRSAFLGAAYVGDDEIVKLTATAGLFSDTLSYLGATEAELALDRRHNPLRPDEVDRFGEQIAAISYTRQLGSGASTSATAYRISASGSYDVCISECDQTAAELWNFHLDFVWYGVTAAWNIDRGRLQTSIGANANTYARDHHAYARPARPALYFNTGHKDDAAGFVKLSYDAGPLTLFGDLQARQARFRYEPDLNAGIGTAVIDWTFVSPKVGATLRLTPVAETYAFFGVNTREPARSDMFGGFDNLDTSNVAFVGPFSRVRPERVHDAEAGLRLRHESWSLEANAFSMAFTNEILPVGQLTYIGTPLRRNVGSSWRRGVEVDAIARPFSALTVGLSASAMRGRIAEFTDEATGTAYFDVEPLLTPKFVAAGSLEFRPFSSLAVSTVARYASRAQLDNTGRPNLTLPAYLTTDVRASWERGAMGASLFLNNATNTRRFGSGHVSFGEARYYVLPPRNLFLEARLGW
jgi:iron complex outermembrane receptor protein